MSSSNMLSNWIVVLQTHKRELVLYNSSLQQLKTVRQTPTNQDAPVPWSSPSYFRILADMFLNGAAQIPFSLNDFLMNGYFEKFFPIRQKIGSGGCGSVYRVEHCLAGIRLAVYAVKVIPVGEFSWLQRVINEVKLLEQLSQTPHPLILGYKHCWIEEWQPATFGPKIPCLFILMEFANRGNLESYIAGPKTGLYQLINPEESWQIFINIAIAVHHLHSLGILHRDLKLSNVLIFDEPNNSPLHFRFALSDFGTAIDLHSIDTAHKRTGATGTIETMAPELFVTDKNGDYLYRHSCASDIWSLGVIMLSLFYGFNPFVMDGGEQKLRNFTSIDNLINEMNISVVPPPAATKLIKKMMRLNPKERCTIDEILADPTVYDLTIKYGLNKLVSKDNHRIVIVSPSMDDLKNSALALPCEESHTQQQPKRHIQRIHNNTIRRRRPIFDYRVILFLAMAANPTHSYYATIIHLLITFAILVLSKGRRESLICLPLMMLVECVTGISDLSLFLFILVIYITIVTIT